MKSKKDNNLYSMLCNIQDPRRPQGRMHKVGFILLIVLQRVLKPHLQMENDFSL